MSVNSWFWVGAFLVIVPALTLVYSAYSIPVIVDSTIMIIGAFCFLLGISMMFYASIKEYEFDAKTLSKIETEVVKKKEDEDGYEVTLGDPEDIKVDNDDLILTTEKAYDGLKVGDDVIITVMKKEKKKKK